jgi:protease IV
MQSMKSILKQVLIVVIGIFTSVVLFLAIGLLLLQPSKPKITDKTVLHIALRGEVVEHIPDTLKQFFQGEQDKVIDLIALKNTIEYAQKDKNIQGIYLEADALKAGWASLEEIRNALLAFQKTGKFIVAYGEHYTQKTYYLASLADDIVLHPESTFPLKGLSQTVFFYKALLDQLEVAPQVFRVGKYKSAVEPFMRQDMSQESKYQSSRLLGVVYDHFLDSIVAARGLKKASIQAMADSLLAIMPRAAHQAKLVSQVGYFDDAESLIKTRLSLAKEAAINYVSFDKYASCIKQPPESSKKQIAVLIVEGTIVDGAGAPGTVGSKDLASSLRAISKDKSIKAVVLRINSPGGSALAADVLWKELILTRAQKPVVASMSDVAASGGYYLAAACDRILAHPTTITGSIGIFGLFFDVHALLSNKLGITTDVVKTGGSADLFENPGRAFDDYEKAIIQKVVDKGYHTFLERVAEGRKMKKEIIARVAGGRVWTGQDAQEKGLVDELGGLEAAVQAAAQLSDMADEFTVSYWPKPRTLSEQVLSGWKNSVGNETTLRALQKTFPTFKYIQELIDMTGIQARLPYRVEME